MKIAVLGAGGMLGHKIYQYVAREFPETFAVFHKPAKYYRHREIFSEPEMRGGFEARSGDEVRLYLDALKPDVVVNCIGLTTRKLEAQTHSDIIAVNAVLPHILKEWCRGNSARLIHFSTDCVFSGKSGPYDETSAPDAKDLYGRSKGLGEVDGEGFLTIRSSIVGLELEGKSELLEWFLKQRGQRINGFSQVYYSGVTTTTMAKVVCELLKKKIAFSGIRQLASPVISKHDLLMLTNEIFAAGVAITPVDQPVSNKVLKQSSFFNDLGIYPPSWREQLTEVFAELPHYEKEFANGEYKRKAS